MIALLCLISIFVFIILLLILLYDIIKDKPHKKPFIYALSAFIISAALISVSGDNHPDKNDHDENIITSTDGKSSNAVSTKSNATDSEETIRNRAVGKAKDIALSSIKESYPNASSIDDNWDNYSASKDIGFFDIKGTFKDDGTTHNFSARIIAESNECIRLTIDDKKLFWNEQRQDDISASRSKNK